MPTYDYHCDACQYAFEKFHSMMDKPVKKCPKCGKLKVRRLLGTGGGIIFKGSGFYQTDYKKKPEGEKDKTAPETGGKKESQSESQASAKADKKSSGKETKK